MTGPPNSKCLKLFYTYYNVFIKFFDITVSRISLKDSLLMFTYVLLKDLFI